MSAELLAIAKDRADWLVDAIGGSTQNRMFLRGDPEEDKVATEAIILNGEKAILDAITRILALRPAAPVAGGEQTVVSWSDPRIMFVCQSCEDHNPEGAVGSRDDIGVMPDGTWLCSGCYDDCDKSAYGMVANGVDDFEFPRFKNLDRPNASPPTFGAVFEAGLRAAIDKYGLALMMIREGCADPIEVARSTLAALPTSTWDGPLPRPQKREDGVPTRIDIRWYTAAEAAIRDAMQAVERAGASIALTDAINFLSMAKDRVADHVEGAPEPTAAMATEAAIPTPAAPEPVSVGDISELIDENIEVDLLIGEDPRVNSLKSATAIHARIYGRDGE